MPAEPRQPDEHDPALLQTIESADRLLQQIEQEQHVDVLEELRAKVEPLLEELAPILLSPQALRELPTRLLGCDYLDIPTELHIRLGIWKQSLSDLINHPEGPPDPHARSDLYGRYRSLYRVGTAVKQYAIYRELVRRHKKNEDRDGKVIREFLAYRKDVSGNEETQYLEALRNLLFHRNYGLRLPGDTDDEEKRAIAHGKIFEKLSEFWSMPTTALDPEGLEALIEGRFNKTAWKIRDAFRDELRRELRISSRENVDSDLLDRVAKEEPETAPAEARIMLEKVARSLTPRQRQFLEIRLQCSSDKEAAKKMNIRPSAASQLFSQIKKTAAEALAD